MKHFTGAAPAGNLCLRSIALSIAMAACGTASAQAGDDGWRWSIAPYVWGSDVTTDVTFPSGQAIGGTLKFSDIVDKLDFAALVHVEGHRGEWGMLFDATYLTMSDRTVRGPITADSDIDFGLYELAGVYTPGGADGPFSVFAGVRYVDASLDLEFVGPGPIGPVSRGTDASYADFLIGGRYLFPFGERWALNVRGDLGEGETDGDWGVAAQLGWRFGGDLQHAVIVGWRHIELDFEKNARRTDVTLDGPLVGVSFGL